MSHPSPVYMSMLLTRPASLLVGMLLTATLSLPSTAVAAKQCPTVPPAAKKHAMAAGKLKRAKKYLAAAQSFVSAAESASVCRTRQMQYVRDALEAFDRATAADFDATKCEDLPDLAATRLLVRQSTALSDQPDAQQHLQAIDGLLQARDPLTRATAELLEAAQSPPTRPVMDLATIRDVYRAAATRFPACTPQLRDLLISSTLARIPAATTAPSCASPDEQARRELGLTLDTVAATEPGATSPALEQAKVRFAEVHRPGAAVESAQRHAAEAATAGNHTQAHTDHVTVLRGLPECPAYHQARGDALGGALTALRLLGTPEARTDAINLLDSTLKEWRVAYGAAIGPDYKVYDNHRRSLIEQQDRYLAAEAEKTRAASGSNKKKPLPRRAKRLKARKPAPLPSPRPTPPKVDGRRMSGNIAGLAVSGTLTIAFGLTATVLSAQLRRKGPIYRDIVDAYTTEHLNPYTTADLCAPSTHETIAAACAHHTTVRHTAIAMWSLTAASAVSTIVLTALTAKASKGRARNVSFGVNPSRTGALLTGTLRF